MRIGDILYFAPGIRFDDVELDGARLPGQFRQRVVGFYIVPSEECAVGGHAFAAGALLVSCIDALARLRFGDRVGERFRKFVAEELKGFSGAGIAQQFYDEIRNGLVHEGRLKNGAQFSFEIAETAETLDGILVVNPKHLAAEVRSALDCYVVFLQCDERELTKLAGTLKQDLSEDFRVARSSRIRGQA